jgi:hypothetical protein
MVHIDRVETRKLKIRQPETEGSTQAKYPMVGGRVRAKNRLIPIQSGRFLAKVMAESAMDWWIVRQIFGI